MHLGYFYLIAISCVSGVCAQPVDMRSGPERVELIELYTSEGCSSCPPAEKWLGELIAHPQLFKEFVPVAFHVDYWDNLGWPDLYASSENTQRQRLYSALWRASTIYTPGFVRNGEEWRSWRAAFHPKLGAEVGDLSVATNGDGNLETKFHASKKWTAPVLHLAVLGCDLESKVTRGENRGATLLHHFVVLASSLTPMSSADGKSWLASLPLPERPEKGGRLALVAWIQDGENPAPIQVVGGWWPGQTPNP